MDRVPLRGTEYAALQALFAAVSHYQELFPVLEKRAKLMPGLWRDMKLVEAKTQHILQGILNTVPENKLRHILADCRNIKLYVKIEPPGAAPTVTVGYSYTPTRTLNELLCYVCEHECLMCGKTPTEARHCEIRRIIEDALPHEIKAKDGEHCRWSDFTLGLEG